MTKTTLSLLLASGLLVAGSAVAQNPGQGKSAQQGDTFASLDSNNDGKLSQSEFGHYAASMGKKSSQEQQAEFKAWDSDSDGSISKAEFDAKAKR